MKENNLKVTIIPEDFRDAPSGYNHSLEGHGEYDCVLAMALRRQFPDKKLAWVGAHEVAFKRLFHQERKYRVPREWGLDLESSTSIEKINEISEQAKISLEGIPTVEIELTEI